MGGHGGLNILPQKKWNVYGREQRLKVARDEEKHEAEERKSRDIRISEEKEHRHRTLLQRARGMAPTGSNACPKNPLQKSSSDHINFFEEVEANSSHPDNDRTKKEERSRRGNPDTQTMDPRFDESFKLGHNMSLAPWYGKSTLPGAIDNNAARAQMETWRNNGIRALLKVNSPKMKKKREKEKEKKMKEKAVNMDVLRMERLQREAEEQKRIAHLLR